MGMIHLRRSPTVCAYDQIPRHATMASDYSAARVGLPPGWHRLRLLRQIGDQLVPGVEQFCSWIML